MLPIGWDAIARTHGRAATLAFQRAADHTVGDIAATLTDELIDADFSYDGMLSPATDGAQLARRPGAHPFPRLGPKRHRPALAQRHRMRRRAACQRGFGWPLLPSTAPHSTRQTRSVVAEAAERRGAASRDDEGTRVHAIGPGAAQTAAGEVRADVVVMALEGHAGTSSPAVSDETGCRCAPP